jgi:hypothetical protein
MMKRNEPFKGEVVFGNYSRLGKLDRALRRGTLIVRPVTRKAMERHKWYRSAVFLARERIRVGQERPGDRELAAI